MLFDLRGRGRRRTVQVIYLTLALLLGGGLVLFGIGGDVQGGLFDAFRENPNDDGSSAIRKEVDKAEAKARQSPQDATAWAELAKAEYQYAGVGKGFDDARETFTAEGRRRLAAADRAWQRHLKLAGDKPNLDGARIMVNVYAQDVLNKPEQAVRAQEIVIDQVPKPGPGDFSTLAVLAYQANQTRKGDLAADRAVELAPKADRKTLRAQLEQAKTGGGAQAGGAQAAPSAGQPTQPPG
jgi:hypothetical protein